MNKPVFEVIGPSNEKISPEIDYIAVSEIEQRVALDGLDMPILRIGEVQETQIGYYLTEPTVANEASPLIVRLDAFGNGNVTRAVSRIAKNRLPSIAEHRQLGNRIFADLTGSRVITLPYQDLDLSKEERGKVAFGDLGPIATRYALLVEELSKDDQSVSLEGISWGGQLAVPTAMALSGERNLETLSIFDPTGIEDSSVLQLLWRFVQSNDLKGVTEDTQSQYLAERLGDIGYTTRDLGHFARSSMNKQLGSVLRAMTKQTLPTDLDRVGNMLPKDSGTALGRDSGSLITPRSGLQDVALEAKDSFTDNGFVVVELLKHNPETAARGHAETNNHLTVFGLYSLAQSIRRNKKQ